MVDSPVVGSFDGLCEPRNPGGTACGGWVLLDHPRILGQSGGKCFGTGAGMTNNVAEYQAALCALRAIYKAGWRGAVILRGDSQLVCRHYSGRYECRADLLVPLLAQLRKAATCFSSLTLEWVPREQNESADEQSRLAYKEVTGRMPPERVKR